MKIDNFFEDVQQSEQYDYKILVYGNYTFRANLEADSFVEVLRHILPYMSKRWKIHFTVLVPEFIKSLDLPNVTQEILEMPSYPNQMRTHFNSIEFLKVIDWKRRDYDIVYSHLPEHTAQIANCFENTTNMSPKIIGYSHWFEVPENTFYSRNMLLSNFAGILQMEECGVNSEWLKRLIIDKAAEVFNNDIVGELDKKIQPHYLGVDRAEKKKRYFEPQTIPKIHRVVFNHRANQYTGWDWFSDEMDMLWQKRQDFVVYTTLVEDVERPWHRKLKFESRNEYMEFLGTCDFGVGAFTDYSAWSISTTDGLSVGVPYLLPRRLCYPEMVGPSYPYLYEHGKVFREKFEDLLNSPDPKYDVYPIASEMLWENRLNTWFNGWENVFNLWSMKDTDTLKQIISFIKKNKVVTKKQLLEHLGWGVRIKFSAYRNYLRSIDGIKFTKTGYEWVN